ncbi:MAG: acetylglutamate kinase [Actinomycetota bacterium]
MSDENGQFAEAIRSVVDLGETCVIVHGGGPQIDAALKESGVASSFLGGFRVTSPEVFSVVQRVLSGDVLRGLVATLRNAGLNAVGLTGRDGGLLLGRKLTSLPDGTKVELGRVGEVVHVNSEILTTLLEAGFLPVVSPIASEGDEISEVSEAGLNVNADLAAGAIAGELKAETLLFLTDVPGIYRHWPDETSLIGAINYEELRELLPNFSGGMVPKVSACLNAIERGAKRVRVIDGNDPQAFALALRGIGGTVVTA